MSEQGWREFIPKMDETLRFYSLVNPSRDIEVEATHDEVTIKHHGKAILTLCKDEARKLIKALEYATPETNEYKVNMATNSMTKEAFDWLSKMA